MTGKAVHWRYVKIVLPDPLGAVSEAVAASEAAWADGEVSVAEVDMVVAVDLLEVVTEDVGVGMEVATVALPPVALTLVLHQALLSLRRILLLTLPHPGVNEAKSFMSEM